MLAYCQRSEIFSRTLQNDLPQEGILPPRQNQLKKWVSQPSTATPCNSTLAPVENALKLKTEAWHQCHMFGMKYHVSPKIYSKGGEVIPE